MGKTRILSIFFVLLGMLCINTNVFAVDDLDAEKVQFEKEMTKKHVGKTYWIHTSFGKYKEDGKPANLQNLSPAKITKITHSSIGIPRVYFVSNGKNYYVEIFDKVSSKFSFNWHFIQQNPFKTFKFSKSIWDKIKQEKISIGMTKEAVWLSWNYSDRVNKSVGSWGVHEQWVYGSQYLYFENGKLTSWQE